MGIGIGDTPSDTILWSSSNVSLSSANLIMATWSKSTSLATIAVNGVAESKLLGTGGNRGTAAMTIGYSTFQGDVAELRLYNTTLTTVQLYSVHTSLASTYAINTTWRTVSLARA